MCGGPLRQVNRRQFICTKFSMVCVCVCVCMVFVSVFSCVFVNVCECMVFVSVFSCVSVNVCECMVFVAVLHLLIYDTLFIFSRSIGFVFFPHVDVVLPPRPAPMGTGPPPLPSFFT